MLLFVKPHSADIFLASYCISHFSKSQDKITLVLKMLLLIYPEKCGTMWWIENRKREGSVFMKQRTPVKVGQDS